MSWEDLAFLREATSLPIVLKGILHPDDARRAQEAGVDGVIVSNHGGRQVDGAVAALDALPGVCEAAPELEVLFDSGVRCAADAVKALALGARAVLIGRPYVWALGVGGEAGVAELRPQPARRARPHARPDRARRRGRARRLGAHAGLSHPPYCRGHHRK